MKGKKAESKPWRFNPDRDS
uniref:Uncharacterized protein n=1 Tax=Anguilla anguilla TaxID=7936 RepID=A0A0E9THH8_ANGAN